MRARRSRLRLFGLLAAISVLAAPAAIAAAGSGTAPCGVRYEPSDATAIAHALIYPNSGRTVILYNPSFLNWAERHGGGAAMFRYLMQHECAHHVLGHITALAAGDQAFVSASRHLELEADCYAAKQLAALGDARALQAALMLWNSMGTLATGPYHPTGLERSATLSRCYGATGEPMPGF